MPEGRGPPEICPGCGAQHTYEPHYASGGGWQMAYYRCESCGRKHYPLGSGENDTSQ